MSNEYGLDVSYFMLWSKRVFREDLDCWMPSELARELARMSMAADSDVLLEPEFTKSLREQIQTLQAEVERLRAKDIEWLNEWNRQEAEIERLKGEKEKADELAGAILGSMNTGKKHEIYVDGDDEPVLPQRKEWCEWVIELAQTLRGKQ